MVCPVLTAGKVADSQAYSVERCLDQKNQAEKNPNRSSIHLLPQDTYTCSVPGWGAKLLLCGVGCFLQAELQVLYTIFRKLFSTA